MSANLPRRGSAERACPETPPYPPGWAAWWAEHRARVLQGAREAQREALWLVEFRVLKREEQGALAPGTARFLAEEIAEVAKLLGLEPWGEDGAEDVEGFSPDHDLQARGACDPGRPSEQG